MGGAGHIEEYAWFSSQPLAAPLAHISVDEAGNPQLVPSDGERVKRRSITPVPPYIGIFCCDVVML